MWHIWLIVAGVCFVLEIFTVGFFIFWFGIGALLAMVSSFIFPNNLIIQTSIFIVSSIALLFLTKPLVKKFTSKDKKVETNAYSIIGKKGIVTQDINPAHSVGQVKISGETWSAKTSDNSIIEKGSQIKVTQIDGVKAIVEAVNANVESIIK